jgi:formate dehydrogenase maturation protein FdhE
MNITEEQQVLYVEQNGNNCPNCNSPNLIQGLTEFDGEGMMYQGVHCKDCLSSWTDMFTLIGVDSRTDLCRTENGDFIK